ncbi:MAG: ABC transporter ATP-binding protein [Candidatus Binatia bacterium]|nr:MAG: ABC transporter ATP-binding protein [Candidatus Binatia bacterium]
MALLEAREVTKVYDVRGVKTWALRGVTLSLEEGEFSALAGPSGSGKTTLLNLLGALDSPTAGRLFFDGEDITEWSPTQRARLRLHKIGFVFQSYNLIPVLTARENVEFVMELQGVPARRRRAVAMELLAELGLSELADKKPLELSGGEQQRVAVARAMASGPRVVLADEPTANLDSETATRLLELMERINRTRGTTFLFSTHDPLVIGKARRTIRLRDGRVVEDTRASP